MISILVFTKNEERTLPGCLASIAWSDDIVVLDSNSLDNTAEIARSANARLITRPTMPDTIFNGDEAEHKNWALKSIPFKNEWVIHLDADERMTTELVQEAREAVRSAGCNVAFRIRRKDFLLGRWLKYTQATPFYIRLFRPEKMRYERLINPVSVPNGPVGQLEGHINHYPFSKGIEHWVDRHNVYSTLEAKQFVSDFALSRKFSPVQAVFARDPHKRRMHQKGLFYLLPARPALKFMLLYVFKGGFLDGNAGLTYAILQSIYEYMIVVKTRESLGKMSLANKAARAGNVGGAEAF